MTTTSHTVGIFSRDSRENYNWLISLLHHISFYNVLPKYVSNRFMEFKENVSKCSFAILYHTLRRGRLNITDMTDSLYDEELEYLCQILGKENVIVVIDDLMDSSDAKMREIIRSQPSIEPHAFKLFLISEKEKKSCIIKGSKAKWSEIATDDSLQEEHNSITDKRNQRKKISASSISQTTGSVSHISSLGDSFNFTRLYDQDLYPRWSRDKLNYAEKGPEYNTGDLDWDVTHKKIYNYKIPVYLIIVSVLFVILMITFFAIHE